MTSAEPSALASEGRSPASVIDTTGVNISACGAVCSRKDVREIAELAHCRVEQAVDRGLGRMDVRARELEALIGISVGMRYHLTN